MVFLNRRRQQAPLSISDSEKEALNPPSGRSPSSPNGGRPRRRLFRCSTFACCGWTLLLLSLLLHYLFTPQPPLTLPDVEPWQVQKAYIGAIVFFREESHALVELLIHLYSQGFSHVLLINNRSKRPLPMKFIKKLQKKDMATLWNDNHVCCGQKSAYRKASQFFRWKGADWIMPVDADEFPFATKLGSLQNYMSLQDEEICSIAFPFRFYGSEGRIQQPNSLLQGFTLRRNMTLHPQLTSGAYKTVSRLRCVFYIGIHQSAKVPRYNTRAYAAVEGFPRDSHLPQHLNQEGYEAQVSIAHYRVQSLNFYVDIKQTRGNAVTKGRVRNATHHQEGDLNDIRDVQVRDMALQRFPALYGGEGNEPDIGLLPNLNYTSPWPMKNAMAALRQVRKHQALAIFDAASSGLPDTLGRATRNAATLDHTWDCVVRVEPGHVESVVGSGVTKLCKAIESHPESQSWQAFVDHMVSKYRSRYTGFAVFSERVVLRPGSDTTSMRDAARDAGSRVVKWKEGVATGSVLLLAGRAEKANRLRHER